MHNMGVGVNGRFAHEYIQIRSVCAHLGTHKNLAVGQHMRNYIPMWLCMCRRKYIPCIRYVSMYVCMYTCMCGHNKYTASYIYTYVCLRTYLHMYACMYIHICKYTAGRAGAARDSGRAYVPTGVAPERIHMSIYIYICGTHL